MVDATLKPTKESFEKQPPKKSFNKLNKNFKAMKEKREKNDITKFRKFKMGSAYLDAIRFSIPLDGIVSIVDSCHYNYFE
jgi:hypothetical protein